MVGEGVAIPCSQGGAVSRAPDAGGGQLGGKGGGGGLTCVYSSLRVYSAVRGCHTAAPSPELGPMTQTDLSASMWLHINISKQTNK